MKFWNSLRRLYTFGNENNIRQNSREIPLREDAGALRGRISRRRLNSYKKATEGMPLWLEVRTPGNGARGNGVNGKVRRRGR
jgi:hypothetical protein